MEYVTYNLVSAAALVCICAMSRVVEMAQSGPPWEVSPHVMGALRRTYPFCYVLALTAIAGFGWRVSHTRDIALSDILQAVIVLGAAVYTVAVRLTSPEQWTNAHSGLSMFIATREFYRLTVYAAVVVFAALLAVNILV